MCHAAVLWQLAGMMGRSRIAHWQRAAELTEKLNGKWHLERPAASPRLERRFVDPKSGAAKIERLGICT